MPSPAPRITAIDGTHGRADRCTGPRVTLCVDRTRAKRCYVFEAFQTIGSWGVTVFVITTMLNVGLT